MTGAQTAHLISAFLEHEIPRCGGVPAYRARALSGGNRPSSGGTGRLERCLMTRIREERAS
jgi:hypothetical protein